MNNTIAQYLTLSQEDYEDKIFDLWFRWCCNIAHNRIDLQRLLANAPLNEWWLFEVNRLEQEWFDQVKAYRAVLDPTTAANQYNAVLKDIFMLKCPPLIVNARKLKIEIEINSSLQ